MSERIVKLHRKNLDALYENLFAAYGPQSWWPAKSRFEVMVGAILTQNTAWTNVEKAIKNLRAARALTLDSLLSMQERQLAELIQPSGYFNVKARRLKNYCHWFKTAGGYRKLNRLAADDLRRQLLSVNGVGPETADDILLYAFERPVFVIDAYTRRLLSRLGWIAGDEPYECLRLAFQSALPAEVALYNEYHALIVRHAKEKCSGHGDCRHCYVESAQHHG